MNMEYNFFSLNNEISFHLNLSHKLFMILLVNIVI